MANLTEPHPAAPRRAARRAPRWRHLATGFTVAGMLFAVTGCGPSASTLSDRFHAHVQQKWGEWVISIDDHKDPAFPSLNPSLQVKPTIPDDVFTQMRADLAAYKDGGFLGGVHVGCIETSGVAVPVSDATTTPAAQAQLEATLQLRRLLAAHGQQITPALSCQEPDVFYGTPAEFMAAARTVAAVGPDGTLQYRIRYRWAKPPGNIAVVWAQVDPNLPAALAAAGSLAEVRAFDLSDTKLRVAVAVDADVAAVQDAIRAAAPGLEVTVTRGSLTVSVQPVAEAQGRILPKVKGLPGVVSVEGNGSYLLVTVVDVAHLQPVRDAIRGDADGADLAISLGVQGARTRYIENQGAPNLVGGLVQAANSPGIRSVISDPQAGFSIVADRAAVDVAPGLRVVLPAGLKVDLFAADGRVTFTTATPLDTAGVTSPAGPRFVRQFVDAWNR